jgi:hypothetical protein
MHEWIRNHGLLLANIALFLIFFIGMIITGAASYSEDQQAHGQATVSIGEYLSTGAFVEATFENWESEFLQMGMYVVLTAYLFQKGSSESKPVGKAAPQDEDPRKATHGPGTPWPVRRGGWVLKVYEHSLVRSVLPAVRRVHHPARCRRRQRLQRGTNRPRPATGHRSRIHRHFAVLVRIIPKLAKRIPRRGDHRWGLCLSTRTALR